jgi:hypothetical protein
VECRGGRTRRQSAPWSVSAQCTPAQLDTASRRSDLPHGSTEVPSQGVAGACVAWMRLQCRARHARNECPFARRAAARRQPPGAPGAEGLQAAPDRRRGSAGLHGGRRRALAQDALDRSAEGAQARGRPPRSRRRHLRRRGGRRRSTATGTGVATNPRMRGTGRSRYARDGAARAVRQSRARGERGDRRTSRDAGQPSAAARRHARP